MINVNMTDKAGVTLATAGKYCADNVKVTPSAEILRKDEQAKTATPTTSVQDIMPDAGKALSKVTVNPITAAIVGNLDADSFAPSIVAAVEGKGVTVPSGTLLDGMASLIESIEAGGGQLVSGTITWSELPSGDVANSKVVFTHNFGRYPLLFCIFPNFTLNPVSRNVGLYLCSSFDNGLLGRHSGTSTKIYADDNYKLNPVYTTSYYGIYMNESEVIMQLRLDALFTITPGDEYKWFIAG